MEAIKVSGWVNAGSNLMLFQSPTKVVLNFPDELDIDSVIPVSEKETCMACLRIIQQDCQCLGLNVTLAKVNRLIDRLETSPFTFRELAPEAKEISERLRDELDSQLFLSVDAKHANYYNDWKQGWDNVITNFHATELDIEEASKSFALNRYTATVFHLMRVMELGLRVLGTSLNDSSIDPKRNPSWDNILRKCRTEQSKPRNQRSPEWQEYEQFYSGVSARLMAVKDAWRNPTMHVDQTYTEETALDVYNHVQSFMRHLATKLHE